MPEDTRKVVGCSSAICFMLFIVGLIFGIKLMILIGATGMVFNVFYPVLVNIVSSIFKVEG